MLEKSAHCDNLSESKGLYFKPIKLVAFSPSKALSCQCFFLKFTHCTLKVSVAALFTVKDTELCRTPEYHLHPRPGLHRCLDTP